MKLRYNVEKKIKSIGNIITGRKHIIPTQTLEKEGKQSITNFSSCQLILLPVLFYNNICNAVSPTERNCGSWFTPILLGRAVYSPHYL